MYVLCQYHASTEILVPGIVENNSTFGVHRSFNLSEIGKFYGI